MILSADPAVFCALAAMLAYLGALLPAAPDRRWPAQLLFAAWVLHAVVLLAGAGVWAGDAQGLRLGFAPVLSLTVWLVLAVHGIESRFLPVAMARRALALAGALAVLLAWVFPGEVRAIAHSRWAPMHWVLGLTSYGLFGAAVLHAVLLDTADKRLRHKGPGGGSGIVGGRGLPLLTLERLTFRFVEAGFVVLTLALWLGLQSEAQWHWDRKSVLSVLGWATFAALIVGRLWRGWRGRQATRWLYAGSLLLLLAYVGTRFVYEVVLQRPPA
ncbi:inner membrane protein YpjD [Ideonella sp.]|uniref:cytochrome C assembly family protein n=1 Tax=Ideonella sp. TaxID=1929293 RepID=UPI0035B3B7AA